MHNILFDFDKYLIWCNDLLCFGFFFKEWDWFSKFMMAGPTIIFNLSCCITDVGATTGGLSSCKIAGVVVGGLMDVLIDLVCHYINP